MHDRCVRMRLFPCTGSQVTVVLTTGAASPASPSRLPPSHPHHLLCGMFEGASSTYLGEQQVTYVLAHRHALLAGARRSEHLRCARRM